MDTFNSLATSLKELMLGIAAIAGVYIAWRGLDAWRQQMRGKTEYEVGLSLLRASFRLREGMALVRQPLMEAGEMAAAMDTLGIKPEATPQANDRHKVAQAAAYEVRWKGISDAMADLDTARIEAEALWGRDPADRVRELTKLVGRLRWAVSTRLAPNDFESNLSGEQRDEIQKTMYLWHDPDSFGESIAHSVRSIEDFVRPKIAA